MSKDTRHSKKISSKFDSLCLYKSSKSVYDLTEHNKLSTSNASLNFTDKISIYSQVVSGEVGLRHKTSLQQKFIMNRYTPLNLSWSMSIIDFSGKLYRFNEKVKFSVQYILLSVSIEPSNS